MLLVELTVNSTLYRLSQQGVALAHWWDNKIDRCDSIQFTTAQKYGGHCDLSYGTISFAPDLFVNDWPPSISCPITAKYADSNDSDPEGSAETLFTGNAHLLRLDRSAVVYDIYGASHSATISGETFSDTLVNVFAWACDAARLNLTLDATAARSPSPAVVHVSDDRILVDYLSDVAAFFCHLFYIDGDTLYLVDMQGNNNARVLTEFEFFRSHYSYEPPVGIITSDANSTKETSYPYGSEIDLSAFHDTQANIETALNDISSLLTMPKCVLKIPFTKNLPRPGEKISWVDTAPAMDVDAYIRVRTIHYNFDNAEITIVGEGDVSTTYTYLFFGTDPLFFGADNISFGERNVLITSIADYLYFGSDPLFFGTDKISF